MTPLIRRFFAGFAACSLLATALLGQSIALSGGGLSSITAGASATVVDSQLTVNSSSTIPGATVNIASGFNSGDVLAVNVGSSSMTASYDSTKGTLTLTGSVTSAVLQTVLRTVTFKPSAATGIRTITFALGSAVAYAGTGHFYQYISYSGTWDQAKADAASRSYLGVQGYLATITSKAENDFITAKLSGDGWIGCRANTVTDWSTRYWYWDTGPEAGTKFCTNTAAAYTVPVNGGYTNWASGEPNDYNNTEYLGEIYFADGGTWNDLPNTRSLSGYVIEYGGMSSNDTAALSSSQSVTVGVNLPVITSPSATNLASTSATLGGTITSDGGYSITGRGVVYALSTVNANPQIGGAGVTQKADASASAGVFNESVTGLTPGATYSFAAYATNAGGTVYTGSSMFTCPTAPTVTTPTNSGVSSTSATLGGTVTSDGGAAVTARGVVYAPTATNTNPKVGGTGVTAVTGTGTTGVFTVSASGLAAGTSYTYAAYATNSVGTAYSATGTFTTTNPPVVSSVGVPSGATYIAGQTLDFTVTWSKSVTVTGSPQLALTVGAATVYATYLSGSGTTSLVFRYTVQAGDADADGIAVGALSLNGGTVNDGSGNAATLTLNSVGSTAGVLVDAVAPTVASVGVPSSGTYIAGQNLDFTVNWSKGVTVTGAPQLALTIGSATVYAAYVSGSGTTALVFRYTVAPGDRDADGIAVGSLGLNGGTIKDSPGNAATLTLNSVGSTTGVLVDAVVPTVTSVGVPTNGTYIAAQNLDFTLAWSKAVVVTGSPRVALTVGAATVYATYRSGSGTTSLVFRYTVAAGDADADGIAVGALGLNGGSIKDNPGNAATLTLNSVGSTAGVLVDAVAPTVASVGVPAGGSYTAGQALDFTVHWTKNVTVTGTPQLALTVGAATVYATYLSGSGTTSLVFRYTVAAGDTAASGITVASPLDLNGGTIADGATNAAALTFTPPSASGVQVDTTAPAVSSISRQNPVEAATGAFSVTYRVTFSEAVAGVSSGAFSTRIALGAAPVSAVSAVSSSVYDVTVDTRNASGTLRLDLKGSGTGITDLAGNAVAGGYTGGDAYTINTAFSYTQNFDGKSTADLVADSWLIAGNATVTSDHLRLTTATNAQMGSAIYNLAFRAAFGVNVQFDYYMGGGTGADGLSFFLLDGAQASPTAGAPGGALGYAYTGSGTPGASQAYLGIGFDRFGNFTSTWGGSSGGLFNGATPNTIAVRGPATAVGSIQTNAEYKFVTGSNVSYAVSGNRKVNLTIMPDGKLTLRISADGGATWRTVYSAFDLAASGAFSGYTQPALFKLGFAASTGGSNNEHDIDNLAIRQPIDLGIAFTTVPSGTQKVGDPVTYGLTVTNSGPNLDPAAAVSYAVPPQITGVTWTASVGDTPVASGSGNTVNPTLNLASGATATITVSGTVGPSSAGLTLAHTATVTPSATFGDTNPADNTGTASTPVYDKPAVTSALTAGGAYGSAFSYTVTASNLPTGFGASGLPSGLSLDPATGVISGRPAQSGTFNVALTGANSAGTGAASTLVLTVAPVALTVAADPRTKVYGTADPALTYSVTSGSLVAGDSFSGGLDRAAGETVGTYAITRGSLSAGANYALTFTGANLAITPATPTILTAPSASAITYLQTLGSSALTGGVASVPGSFAFTTPAAMPVAGTASHGVIFTPADTTDYTTATTAVSVTVVKVIPTISVAPSASAITYLQTLASSKLTGGTANVPGTFAFTSPATAPGAGTASQGVTFTPTDLADCTPATTTVPVTVNKATPTVSAAPSASAITFGQTLASSALSGGAASTAGTFAFTAPATAPSAGTASQGVTFTPDDGTDYTTAAATTPVTVNKATPTVSVPPSASAITYGQTLAASTLSGGSASTAGTFAFTAPATAPVAGTASQAVTFTPADGADFNPAATTAVVKVNRATPAIIWAAPAAITYGTALSAAQLKAASTVAGTFTYAPAGGTILDAGAQTLEVNFTPSDPANYTTASASVSLEVAKAAATLTFGGLTQTYDGAAKAVSVGTTPAGLSVNVIYVGVSGAPVKPGQYTVRASVQDSNYWGAATATMTITAAGQSISFPAVGALIGVPVGLVATATSGLPVSFTLVSGNAALSGATLTIKDGNPVVVRADQPGDAEVSAAASVAQTITAFPSKQSQAITFTPPADHKADSPPFGLLASASSGLPVSFTILGGPAMLAGSTVTLTGAAGTVTVKASQAGNAAYQAAPDVTVNFKVAAAGPRAFFGTVGTGASGASAADTLRAEATASGTNLAAYVAADNSGGTIIGYLPAQAEGFVVSFTTDASGAFTAATTALLGTGAAGPALTFTGRSSGNRISGTILELGQPFSATLDPPDGPTAAIAGFYQGTSLNSSTGSTYSVVGSQGEVYVLAVAPTVVTAGSGAVDPYNCFSISASQSATVTGAIDPVSTTVTGSITTGAGATTSYSGLAATTTRTDRLINLSSRGFVGTGGNILVAGFVIGGTNPKPVLLRAAGPSLASFGIQGVLAKPVLTVYDSAGNPVLVNQGWAGNAAVGTAMSRVGAFAYAANSADSAALATLPPGSYTMQVSGASGTSGIALAEVYDASANPQSEYQRLINISSRGLAGPGAGSLVDGFVVTGNSPKKILIRAVGPELQSRFGLSGTLDDPQIDLYDSGGRLIAHNDNWGTPVTVLPAQVAASASDIAAAARAVWAFPLSGGSRDASVIVTLAPGSYTAQASSASGSQGITLVEVYEIAQ